MRKANPLAGVLIAGALAAGMIPGCGAPTRDNQARESQTTGAAPDAPSAAALRDQARSVTIRRGDGSGTAQWTDVVGELSKADVVLFGEVHGHALGNRVQQELFEDILIRRPGAVLSMEFYERDDQVALDDYLSGVTDRAAFEAAADRNAGNNPRAHARMIDAAKEAGRPVIAANAPRRYVRLARTDGYERLQTLAERQRALLAIPESIPTGAYRDRFVEAMGAMAAHGGDEMIEGFLRSQTVWDATMAQSIIGAMEHGTPVVHVVGYFHAQFGSEEGGSGLIDQLRKRSDRDLEIMTLITLPADDGEIREEDLGIAEFVVYVGEPESD